MVVRTVVVAVEGEGEVGAVVGGSDEIKVLLLLSLDGCGVASVVTAIVLLLDRELEGGEVMTSEEVSLASGVNGASAGVELVIGASDGVLAAGDEEGGGDREDDPDDGTLCVEL